MTLNTEAPYVHHPAYAQAVLELCAPEWLPSPETVALLHYPGEEVTQLVEWAAARGRGLCLMCSEPITWSRAQRLTCKSKCRSRKSRASIAQKKYQREIRVRELLAKLGELDCSDEERRQRHEKIIAIREGTYEPPPRPHAAPRWKPLPLDPDYYSYMYESNLGAHERGVFREDLADDRAKDAVTDRWLAENDTP